MGAIIAPSELKVYADERHAQTVHWEGVKRLPASALLPLLTPPAPLPAPAGLPLTMPVRFLQREILVQAKLNGRDYFLLLDTGTSITIIDKPVAEALRLPPGERMNLRGASGQKEATITRLQSLELDRVRLQVGPETDVLKPY